MVWGWDKIISVRKKKEGYRKCAGTWLITLLRLGGQSWCTRLVAEIPEGRSATTHMTSVDCTSDFSLVVNFTERERKTESP